MKIKQYDYGAIGKRIKKCREMNHLTQAALAQKTGKVDKHISEIERGISGLSIPTLMELCKVLNVESDYILFGKISENVNNPFYNLLNQLTPTQAGYAESIIEIYVKSCLANN